MTSPLPLPASRSTWEVAIAALGLNLWVAFLLLPTLHLDPQHRGPWAWVAALLALGVLAAGLTLRLRVLLVGLYPGALLLGPLVTPRLVGPGIYSRVTFALMALSFMQPTVKRTTTEVERGQAIVLLDNSASMSVADL